MFTSHLLTGALAGFAATVPMTAAMEILYHFLPRREQYPLPPSEIMTKITQDTGVLDHADREQHLAVTMAGHFAYGTAAGAFYATFAHKLPFSPMLRGIGYGLVVWTISYLNLLPALRILRPATEHPAGRNALMIAAHLVWGAALGMLTDRWQR